MAKLPFIGLLLLMASLSSCATVHTAHIPVARYHGYRVHAAQPTEQQRFLANQPERLVG